MYYSCWIILFAPLRNMMPSPKSAKKFKGRLSSLLQILLHPISNSRKVWSWRDNVFKNMNLHKEKNPLNEPIYLRTDLVKGGGKKASKQQNKQLQAF